ERTVLTSLVHPNVVAVRDLVVDGTDLALVMDLVRGTDLRERLDAERALPPAEAVALAADVAAGLAAAHARGVVHRDVKPENVLLDAATGTARLTDFGIARLVDGPRRTRATRIVGTPDYLAPEVIEGCPPGPPVDVYALGTLIFELMTGWTPFGGGHPGAVLRRHVTETVPDVPGMPEAITVLLTSCLSKAPAARLTAAEMAGRLRVLVPELAGLPALRVTDPRAVVDPATLAHGPGPAVPISVGAVPLVGASSEGADASRQTHVNLMRPIREPLGPSAPVPGALPQPPRARDAVDARLPRTRATGPGTKANRGGVSSRQVRSTPENGSQTAGAADTSQSGPTIGVGSEADAPAAAHSPWRTNRVSAVAAVVAAGLVATGGFFWFNGHSDDAKQQPVGAVEVGPSSSVGTQSAAAKRTASPIPVAPKPLGPLGLLAAGQVVAPSAKPLGAVHYVRAGGNAYVVMTGTDGTVRYTSAPLTRAAPQFGPWQALPGLDAAAEPAVVGRASGDVEVYAVSTADNLVHRAVLFHGKWSPWSSLATAGTGPVRVAGAPSAVAISATRTELVVASRSGSLLSATGYGSSTGSWLSWHYVSGAGKVKPDVALAVRSDGMLAAYVVRASDLAVLRLVNSGYWSSDWPTGAVGHPEAAFTGGDSGKPYLFIQSISGDVQVYEPTGANLH
ncbi:MAG: protein kinase domain-containing protein, partial [Actinocrinis sp.]